MPLTEKIIYSVVENGSDVQAIGAVVSYFLLAGFFSYFAMTLRNLRQKGLSIASKSERSTCVRTAMAKYAVPIVVAMSLIGFVLALFVGTQYQADRERLAAGNFASISGTLDDYRVVKISVNGRQNSGLIPGFQPSWDETDRLLVGTWSFIVSCNQPPEIPVASIGDAGQCLPLHLGELLRVDFVKIAPNRYRVGPLRITTLQ